MVDSVGTIRTSLPTPTVSMNSVTAIFDLTTPTALVTGPGSVCIQESGSTSFCFPFLIDGCPPSGVGVTLFGATTVSPGRTWQYVVRVINYFPSATTALSVEVGGIPQSSEILMNPPTSAVVLPSPPPQGFTISLPSGLAGNSSVDFGFDLTPDISSVLSSYTMVAHLTGGNSGSDSLPFTVVGSMDPNDKTGPPGIGAAHYLKGDSMLAYTILFENDPELASAPAQRVVITDQLDPLKVNLSTFLFGPITFGSQLVRPPFGQNPFTMTVPYHVVANPVAMEADILVRIDGNLDVALLSSTYGQITWTFQSIDPATGLPPEHPLIGFLPPDITSPEGQGGVSFQIFPITDLSTHDTIANFAGITFDFNDAIVTPLWINTLDKTAPDSFVAPLGAIQSSPTFTLSWSGTDAGAGIASYTIFVAEDGGAYLPLLTETTAISTVFTGEASHVYSFYSVATDLMGYVEQASAQADVTTQIQGDPCVVVSIGPITAPVDPVVVASSVNANANFTYDCGLHTATWDWGDGTTSVGFVNKANGSGTVTGQHVYTAPGVYTLKLIVTGQLGNWSEEIYQFIVVYNPDGGFVTGGGWINSPAGAYVANPLLVGKATFGFVSKYLHGANVPTGNTEFQFKAGNLNFKSTSYQWLVVAGAKAQYKGSGTINGGGDYGFMLTCTDGQINGGGGSDKFRIKIWDKASSQNVYDNQLGAGDSTAPSTGLGGGNIVIHKD